MVFVRYVMKQKLILFLILVYTIVWTFQLSIFSKPIQINQAEEVINSKYGHRYKDMALEKIANSNNGERDKTAEQVINEKHHQRDEHHGEQKMDMALEKMANERGMIHEQQQQIDKDTSHGQIEIKKHGHSKEDMGNNQIINETRGQRGTTNDIPGKREEGVSREQLIFRNSEQKDAMNGGTMSKSIEYYQKSKHKNESQAYTENRDASVKVNSQQRSCEPEIVQTGSNYKMAKKLWKYKIVQWMPYQRKVVDGTMTDSSMGEFWQVDNCLVVDHLDVENADAVVIPVMSLNPARKYDPPKQYPPYEYSNPSQIRILLHTDHPYFISITKEWEASSLDNYFNWVMTYRTTSDIHAPYGYSFPKVTPTDTHVDYTVGKTKMVSAMISGYHSFNYRMEYIKELGKYIDVDMYGRHGIPCDGHYIESCELLKLYKFYLAFESSNCEEYVTEKLWLNGYHNNILPVVMGPTKKFYESIAPPHSFIHVDDFKTPASLAQYLLYLNGNPTEYNEYFRWKDTHDYCFNLLHLSMQPWRAICKKLNSFQGELGVYKNMSTYLDPLLQCRDAKWKPNYVHSG